jgi:hypothetical protein
MAVFTAIGASIFGAGTFLAGLTAAGLQIAAGLVISSLNRSTTTGETQQTKFGVQGRLQGGEEVPRSINLGFNCTAGSLVWHNTFGDGGTMSARVIALGDLPIRELLSVIVDGVDCNINFDSTHANYGNPVHGYYKNGQNHLWVKFYDGTQTEADPFLVERFGSDPDRPYGSDRIGYGIPYVIVFARAPERNDEGDKPLFQGLPAYKFVTNGVRWYNPAKDTTVGGSGTQRWDTPSTWGGDTGDFNPIVQLYNVLRGIRYDGDWLYGMQALSAARLPVSNWIAGINAAQASISGPGGSEPTYRAGGEVQVGAQVATTVEALLTAANARLVENGGLYTIYVGAPGSPVMSFTDADILSTEEQSFSPFLSLSDTVNGIDASYPNPAEGWNTKKAPTLLRPALEPLAGNRRLLASVSLDMVPYKGQAQRLMKWALAEALRARRHTFVLGPEFRVIEPGDVVRWTSARNGYVDKLFRVDGVIYKSNLDVIVDLTEVDPSDYDWDQEADYTPVIDGPLTLVGPKPMPMSGWQVFPASIYDNASQARRASIEVWFASGLPDIEAVRVQVRLDGETTAMFDGEVPYGDPWKVILAGQFAPSTDYEVRGIFRRTSGQPGEWSAWLGVTTPAVVSDITDIQVSQLGEDLQKAHGLVTGTDVTDIPARLAELRAYAAELALAVMDFNATTKETLNILSVQSGGAVAAVIRNEKAIVEEGFARAEAITEVLASLDDVIAGGFLKFEAEVDELASTATITAKVRATSGTDLSEAAWILKAEADGLGGTIAQFGVLGDFYVFESVDGPPLPVFGVSDGEAVMLAAKINVIRAGRLTSPDGTSFVIDLTGNEIELWEA